MADADNMALPTTFEKIALAIVGALLSIPLAANIEELLHYRSAGVYLACKLFYGDQGGADLRKMILLRVGSDAVLCFAVMSGLYAVSSRLRSRRKTKRLVQNLQKATRAWGKIYRLSQAFFSAWSSTGRIGWPPRSRRGSP
jgi:hypothetical protein